MIQNDGTAKHTLFHYGQQGELQGETQIKSADTSEASHTQNIVWLQMRPVVALDSSANSTNSTNSKPADTQISWLHSDHLLTTRAATDANQNLIWRWHSDAFGVGEAESFTANDQNNQNTEETFTLNLRFPGQYHDQESGLHYNYHRTYDPSMGRYTQSDPIGLMGGANTFAYVGGSPLAFYDLFGLEACEEKTEIFYELYSASATEVFGLGYMEFRFEMRRLGEIMSFIGSVNLSFNAGVGVPIVSGIVSTGILEGPYISWSPPAVMEALNNQLVIGSGFTISIINGVTLGASLEVGAYKDFSTHGEVKGLGIGWEGFRGTLSLHSDSFKIDYYPVY